MAEAYGSEQVARDDDHLRSLGIKPELTRTLGFLSSFAVAFSYISVSTGTFTTFSTGLGVAGPLFFWAWPVVVAGQLFVALNFAELASHFPVAGSIYQWSKRLSNRSLGWFTGWIYFWAGVLTVTAVAVTVPLVLAGLYGFDLASPDPLGITNMQTFLAIVILITTTLINAFGVRLLTLINNIGVAAEIAGMLVFALILLVFANHQSPAILFDSRGLESAANGNVPAIFLVGMFMALFVVYGFDTAGTFGEETVDAARQAPRGILSAIGLSGIVGAIFLLGIILSFQNVDAQIKTAQAFGFPIADTLKQNLTAAVPGTGITFGEIYLVVIAIAVYVCLLAIQGATTRLMFSMGRDRRLPFSSTWAHVHPTFRTPTWAAIAVGVLAAIPFVLAGPGSAAILAISATGLIYLSYFLCNLGVFVARTRGWPHKGAWFSLGSWGTIINLVALLWGGAMIINIGLWESSFFGDFGNSLRSTWSNPLINTFLSFGGKPLDWLPPVPLFEAVVGIIVIVGAAYYAIGERGHIEEEVVQADTRTGEATIG